MEGHICAYHMLSARQIDYNEIFMDQFEAIRAEIIIQIRKTGLVAVHIDACREMHRSRKKIC